MMSQERTYELWPGVDKGPFADLGEDEIDDAVKQAVDEGRVPASANDAEETYGDYAIRDRTLTFDAYALEEALFDAYEDDFVQSVRGVDPQSDNIAKSHAMTAAMLDPEYMTKTLSRLSHDELRFVEYLMLSRGAHWRIPDEEMPPARRLPLVGGWTYAFRVDDRCWDFVMPEQAQEIGRGFNWEHLRLNVLERDIAVNLADVQVECFGAIEASEFMDKLAARPLGGLSSWAGDVEGWICDAARRGRILARVVKMTNGNEVLAHSILLRLVGNDAECVDDCPSGLSSLLGACLESRSDASMEMERDAGSWVELYRRQIHSESGALLRGYLHWHIPVGASLDWPFTTFGSLCDRSRYAETTEDLLDTLEILGLHVPAPFRPELEEILEAFLREMPRWGSISTETRASSRRDLMNLGACRHVSRSSRMERIGLGFSGILRWGE